MNEFASGSVPVSVAARVYKSGLHYDISDMESDVLAFAANSTNQSEYCVKLVCKMKFKSEEASEPSKNEDAPLIFYDVEVFPNLFLVNWKKQGPESKVVRMINPKPAEIEELIIRRFGILVSRWRNYRQLILSLVLVMTIFGMVVILKAW